MCLVSCASWCSCSRMFVSCLETFLLFCSASCQSVQYPHTVDPTTDVSAIWYTAQPTRKTTRERSLARCMSFGEFSDKLSVFSRCSSAGGGVPRIRLCTPVNEYDKISSGHLSSLVVAGSIRLWSVTSLRPGQTSDADAGRVCGELASSARSHSISWRCFLAVYYKCC